MKTISIFIPVYNEIAILEKNTRFLYQYLQELDVPFEIIIGDNGSTDGTEAAGRDLANRLPELRFFHLPHKGVGSAFKQGVKMARGDVVISLDMDLSIDLAFVERAAALAAEYDIVIGSKKMGDQTRSLVRIVGSGLYLLCAKLLLNLPFDDYSIAAKAYRRNVAMAYLDRVNFGTSYVLEMVYLARRAGYKVTAIPVSCHDLRPSKFNLINEAVYRFYNLFIFWAKSRHIPR
ncbi:MAG: glycosyltransferase family 2 protein [Deltaproteobacteria bacterium]|nr:glycosyltransferase family 2 protein [Deltaproteobacteria bacterium]